MTFEGPIEASSLKLHRPSAQLIKYIPWRRMVEWSYSSPILDLRDRWRWLQALAALPPRKSPWYSLDTSLGGPQTRSGFCAEEINFMSLPRIELRPPLICIRDVPASNPGPNTSYRIWWFSTFFSHHPSKCNASILRYATVSFYIPSNPLFTDDYIIQHYSVWATGSVVKQTVNK